LFDPQNDTRPDRRPDPGTVPQKDQLPVLPSMSPGQVQRWYEATPAMLHLLDMSGKIIMASDRWLETFGYTRDQVLGHDILEFLTPESVGYSNQEVFPSFLETGRTDKVSFEMRCSNGELLEALISATLERDDAGQPVYILAIVQDVTLQRTAERALSAERMRLSNILEGTQAATWEWNFQTGVARFNDRWAEILGLTLADIGEPTTHSRSRYTHPDDLARYEEALEQHLQGRTARFECEHRMRHRDGHWVWVLDRGSLMSRTETGEPERMFGTRLDISERKQQEDALRMSEGLLDRTGRLAGIGGWEIDLATNEIYWSAETYRIHGVDKTYKPTIDEAINFYAPEARPIIAAAVEKASSGGGAWDLELPFLRKSGERIWVRAVGAAAFSDGKPVRLMGAFQDVSSLVARRLALQKANERVALATDSGGIGIWESNLTTRQMTWDAWMYRLFGLDEATETRDLFTLWVELLHPEDRPILEQATRDGLAGRRVRDIEYRVVWPDGSIHHLRTSGSPSSIEGDLCQRVFGTAWDITESKRLSAALAQQHELLRVTLRSIGDAVITADSHGTVTWLNPVAERMTGWPIGQAVGLQCTEVFRIVNGQTRRAAEHPMTQCLATGVVVMLASDTVLVARDGTEYGIEDSAAPILSTDGELLGVVLVFHDVTEQRRLSHEISHRATHDPLTGLANRAEFEVRLRELLARSQNGENPSALLFLDLDQFKIVNDTCGHSIGDQLLCQVAKLLTSTIRTSDVVARLGGDEFAVLLNGCPFPQAHTLAQRVCDRMDEFRFIHEDRRFRVGASIGLVPIDDRWSTTSAILQAADSCCYAAKEAGRNRVHAWADSDAGVAARKGEMRWASRLEHALDENLFRLFAQRYVNVQHDTPKLHAEVLIRMLDENGSLIQPGVFLPAAERFRMISRIDRWVLSAVIAWLQSQPSLDFLDCLNVNLSGQSIGDRAFHTWALEKLSNLSDEIRGKLCLEITETAVVTDLDDAAVFIRKMRELNVRTALDDFGAGASSFGYLHKMPVDFLKIDGQFIRNLATDRLNQAAVRCFIEVADALGLHTVAECVEDQVAMQQLQAMGADYAQGFFIHRPEAIDALLTLIPAPDL
jgi:diguanylate cyclase (GGDEF)-like protein/PAS domain S-box-containing protein